MAADNASAFNCRAVSGGPKSWSVHAYGKAIDLNPVENPYVHAGARGAARRPCVPRPLDEAGRDGDALERRRARL